MKTTFFTSRIQLVCGLVLLGIDLFTKWLANLFLSPESIVNTAIPFWKWFLTYNEGYHYIFGEIRYFRITQALGLVAVSILIWVMMKQRVALEKNDPTNKLFGLFISLLIGATGNPWETLFLGRVTDFFIFTPLPWPSNLADQYINLSIFILLPVWIYLSYRENKREKQSAVLQGTSPENGMENESSSGS